MLSASLFNSTLNHVTFTLSCTTPKVCIMLCLFI